MGVRLRVGRFQLSIHYYSNLEAKMNLDKTELSGKLFNSKFYNYLQRFVFRRKLD